MNIVKIALILLVFVLIISVLFIVNGENTEKLIEGDWREVSWKYEKVDGMLDSIDGMIEEEIKNEIYKNIIIHKVELWNFKPKGILMLSGSKETGYEKLHWSIKGRGHVLELTHDDGRMEDYQIELLTDDLLILYFSFDIQIRGIVKITFIRN